MNETKQAITPKMREHLDRYLDAVERVLAESRLSRTERHAVCDEIEDQACEMLSQRAPANPTEQDMQAVIAELDDPEAYRDSTAGGDAATPRAVATGLESKVHPFAIWAFLVPVFGLLIVFSAFSPRGEVPTFLWFGIVSAVSIMFAVLAIRDIRRDPERYVGTSLAIFGALTIPLLILNTLVIVNVSELNPLSHVLRKQRLIESVNQFRRSIRELPKFTNDSDLPLWISKPPSPQLTGTEQWLVDNVPWLFLTIDVAIIGASALFSALLFIWLYRRYRPQNEAEVSSRATSSKRFGLEWWDRSHSRS